jgi:hypothetical protein
VWDVGDQLIQGLECSIECKTQKEKEKNQLGEAFPEPSR